MIRTRTPARGNTGLGLPTCKAPMVLAAVVLACCAPARALDPSLDVSQYAHTSWKVHDGFTKGLIVTIAQSTDGYLWIGTEFGLVRFDGVRAVPWQPPTGQQLPSNNIQVLLSARDGTLWIGTLSGLASWKDGKLTTYPEMAGQQVFPLLEDHEGAIWAGGVRTPTGAKLCSIRNARMDCHGGDGSLGAGFFGLYEDRLQNLWVGVSNGFWRWKPGPQKFFPASSDTGGIRSFGEDDQHALLIGTKGGIRRFVNGRFEAHPLRYRQLTTSVGRILRDREGNLWIPTLTHGLVHVHGGKTDTFSSSDGLSGDSVFDVREDREGSIWVATSGGLDKFHSYSIPTISRSQGIGNPLIFSVLAARGGRVWIATPSGLDAWDQGKISAFLPSNGGWSSDGTIGGPVPNSLFEDSSGRIWVSMHRRFGYLDNGRFVSVSGYQGGWVHGIAGIAEWPPGHLWVPTQPSGLLEVFQGKVVQQRPWPGLGYEQNANDLAVDPAKNGLWLGFREGGIAYFAGNKVQAYYSVAEGLGQGTVNHLRFDSNGTLWAATDGGLSRIQDGHISTLTSRNGLPCDLVYWTIEDDEHAVWLYTMCGLVRVARGELDAWAAGAKRTIDVKVLDASDGVGTHSWVGSGCRPLVTKTKDGKIWFVTSDGLSIIDPHHLPFNSLPPPVHIEQIMADDKPYNPATGLRLPSHVHYLTIDYTALSLVVPAKVRFRYKLEGMDPGWREVINDREVQYSNLPPGHYRFHVIAANDSGVWNEAGAFLEFSIAPAYYQTNWFRMLCVAAFLALLWAAYQIRIRHLQQKFATVLDARVSERTRIARELHDTLLQSLHGLLMSFQRAANLLPERPIESKQRLDEAIDQAARAVTEGREAVQGLRSSTVVTNDLAVALRTLGEELVTKESSEISPEFHVGVAGTQRDLNPLLRDDVYRIAGEAVRNAFQHARARRIEVEIRYDERQLRVHIRDDGKGVDSHVLSDKGRSGHWGLPGMRERAKLVGGQLEIWSQVDSGTEIELRIPASIAYHTSTRRPSRERTA